MTGSEVTLSKPAFLQRAREDYDPRQAALIKQTVAKGANDAELGMFLELSAHLQLNPFAGEIWCAKLKGKDGGGDGQMVIMVGINGLLKVADRSGQFEGLRSGVVHEHDTFEVSTDENNDYKIKHAMPNPKDRGEVVGAWAICHRKDRAPYYTYAPLTEYMPKSEGKLKWSPWGSQKSAMIRKCAESLALRRCFSITGVVGDAEMDRNFSEGVIDGTVADHTFADWGDDPEFAERFQEAVRVANELHQNSWTDAKLQMVFTGQDHAARVTLVEQIEKANAAAAEEQGVESPPSEDEKVEDAVVV